MANFGKGTRLGVRLDLRSIENVYLRNALQEIQDFLNQQDILRGVWRWVTYEYTDKDGPFPKTFNIQHNMPFVPCDFLITATFGGITAGVDHDTVTKDTFDLTLSGPGRVRMLVGNITNLDRR